MGLEMSHYVRDGRKTLTVLIGLVGVMFLLEKLNSLLVIEGVLTLEDSILISGLILIGYLVVGVYMLTGGVSLAFRLYKIEMGAEYGHITVTDTGLDYKSPLGHKSVSIPFAEVKHVEVHRLDDFSVRLNITKKFTLLSGDKEGEKFKIFLTKEKYTEVAQSLKEYDVNFKLNDVDVEVAPQLSVREALIK